MTIHLAIRGRALRAVATAATLLLAACNPDKILKAKDPDIINPGDINSPAGAQARYAGGIGDYALAIDGDGGVNEGQTLVSGMFTDEYLLSGTFPTRLEYDSRAINLQNGTLSGIFRNLQRARISIEHTIPALQQYLPDSNKIGEMFALDGLVYTITAENYCSGVPFSDVTSDGTAIYGAPLTTTQILDRAVERFDSALAVGKAASILNLARVGRARALLDKGDFATAGTAVTGVPTNFSYLTTHTATTTREQNGINVFNWGAGRWSVADTEGINGLNFRSANDPRVQVVDAGKGFDATTELYDLLKYPTRTTSVVQAGGVEARLIEAEAQLRGGDGAGAITALNALRADSAHNGGFKLPALTDPGPTTGDSARVTLLFRERAFWLFATGHRLGDWRRLVRQYGRQVANVYTVGPYFKGSVYGTDLNLPVPFDEENNPLFTGCIDRNP